MADFRPQERRPFALFLHRVAPILSGPLDASLKSQLIPQMSHSEPIIRDAVLVISCLYKHPHEPNEASGTRFTEQQPLKLYNRAITGMKARIHHDSDPSIALLSCLLFICIEQQQNNPPNVVSLLKHAFDMLSTIRHDSTVRKVATPFLARHAVLSGMAGYSRLLDHEKPKERFSTLQDARSSLFALMEECHDFLNLVDRTGISQHLTPQQQVLLSRLRAWYSIFTILDCTSPDEICAASYLLMNYNVFVVWLSTKLSPSKTASDEYNREFENILHHASIILASYDGSPPFTLEMGVIGQLYFVASKCRHPVIRRRALALVRRAPAREGLWSVLPTLQVLERIVALEEATNGHLVEFPPTRDEISLSIEEEKRIRHLEVFEYEPGCGAKIKIRPGGFLRRSIRALMDTGVKNV